MTRRELLNGHHPDGPSTTYYRKRCNGFESAPGGADAEMGTDLHERSVTGDVTGLSWYDSEALQFFWEETIRQVFNLFGENAPRKEIETRVDIRDESGEVVTFGTPDRVYWHERVGLVTDAKFGWYAPADPIQLKLYALGLLQEKKLETVRGVFICPRVNHAKVQVWTWSAEDLHDALEEWHTITLQSTQAAVKLTPAVDVCGNCGNLPNCLAAKRVTDLALDKRRVELADPQSVSENLERCAVAKKHIEAYQDWALSEARKGFQIPGWTTQRRSGSMKVTDAGRFYVALNDVVPGQEITQRTTIHVAQVRDLFARRWAEKTGGKIREGVEKFKEITADCVEEGTESWSLKREEKTP